MTPGFWRRRRVFITGHTGFKGGWLTLWLSELGAEVYGYALEPPTTPNLFTVAHLSECLSGDVRGDVRDLQALGRAMLDVEPEIVLHLAAQPLVRAGYADPVATYAINVMGTVHLLEAVRLCPSVRAAIVVTTDKCYDNREWVWPYRENDPLGGHDPYSSSKAAAELVTQAYRSAFLADSGVQIASVRAGNVIGGGDWARDRLIPDVLRALDAGEAVRLRSPQAIRPWQHVLEPLAGYLSLAERLHAQEREMATAWNFGPDPGDAWTVEQVVHRLCECTQGHWQIDPDPGPRESVRLDLDSTQARIRLGWRPRWNLAQALERTLAWHRAWRAGADMQVVSRDQIRDYQAILS
ncbi:CDP-glucose 4,6-dehydratase [Thermochromatium tepidum]|uniref:CDP-glucose 4,6-dehydratase n=1 Tax=Thermochromatium tepidum ATCC 43061 TaxID=316276 RepID=A0A6I6E470_THETI|nr:CDP-glucose 4,6-dehydratase [Thermochromatium tepidum]QGU32552.1 CDP-glucose 4,6-dehydratase [Thermochromatium tepidum ATCC 43061]